MTKRTSARVFGAALALALVSASVTGPIAQAGERPAAAREHGFAPERLARITERIGTALEENGTPGAVALVMRNGTVVYEHTFGVRDPAADDAMAADDIFRIYSMTKPITSVAVMMLWEAGKLDLTAPIGKYIPALADRKVAVMNADGSEILRLETPRRQPTVQDFLRHTSGVTYGNLLGGPDNAVARAYDDAGIVVGDRYTNFPQTLETVPLAYEPGTVFSYGLSTDVLGHLVAVVSGQSFGVFLQENLFDPLGMDDTGFVVPEADHDRIAQPDFNVDERIRVNYSDPRVAPGFEAGGVGLMSTAHDYARFAQMMLNGGSLDGVRILSPKTVDLMRADHLPAHISDPKHYAAAPYPYLPGPGHGFGLGFSVRKDLGLPGMAGSVGTYRWGGLAGTSFLIDPEENLVTVFMIQDIANRATYRALFDTLVYSAIVE